MKPSILDSTLRLEPQVLQKQAVTDLDPQRYSYVLQKLDHVHTDLYESREV